MIKVMHEDGVVKYVPRHRPATLEAGLASLNISVQAKELIQIIQELNEARTELHDLNLIGVSPAGTGFGNLSHYLADGMFVISGSGTGAPRILGAHGYCLVQQVSPEANEVCSTGPVQPSSESMTHAAVYAALPEIPFAIRCVIHVHSSTLFAYYLPKAPGTPASAAYGTPELARAVRQLIPALHTANGFFVLTGHQDGLVFFGDTVKHTMETIRLALQHAENAPSLRHSV